MLGYWMGLLLDKVLVKVLLKELLVHWQVKVLAKAKVRMLVDRFRSESTLLVNRLLAAQVWLQVDGWRVWHRGWGGEGRHWCRSQSWLLALRNLANFFCLLSADSDREFLVLNMALLLRHVVALGDRLGCADLIGDSHTDLFGEK